MRKCLLILAFAIVIHEPLYSARIKYSLPSNCLLSDGVQSFSANRLEIYAIQDEIGRVASPFQFVGYGEGDEIIFNLVYKSRRVEMLAHVLSSDLERDVVRREDVHNGFKIEDCYLRLSVNIVDGQYQTVVRDLYEDRVQENAGSETARVRAMLSTNWPHMDGEYVYRGSRGEVHPISQLTEGENKGENNIRGGCLYCKGALYQKGDDFLIRYALTHEAAGGKCVAHTNGHVVGKFSQCGIHDCVDTLDAGDDVFRVQVGLTPAMTDLPHYDELLKELRERGVEEYTLRLRIDYKGRTFNLDFGTEVKSITHTSAPHGKGT